MKRFACVAAVCLVATLGVGCVGSSAGDAGRPTRRSMPSSTSGRRWATSRTCSVGGEFGYRLTQGPRRLSSRASHMGNVGTSDLDDRATIIANASRRHRVDRVQGQLTFDVGVRYNIDRDADDPSLRDGRRRRRARQDRSRVHRQRHRRRSLGHRPARQRSVRSDSTRPSSCSGSASTCRSRPASSAISAIATARSSRRPTTSKPIRRFRRSASCSASASDSNQPQRRLCLPSFWLTASRLTRLVQLLL